MWCIASTVVVAKHFVDVELYACKAKKNYEDRMEGEKTKLGVSSRFWDYITVARSSTGAGL